MCVQGTAPVLQDPSDAPVHEILTPLDELAFWSDIASVAGGVNARAAQQVRTEPLGRHTQNHTTALSCQRLCHGKAGAVRPPGSHTLTAHALPCARVQPKGLKLPLHCPANECVCVCVCVCAQVSMYLDALKGPFESLQQSTASPTDPSCAVEGGWEGVKEAVDVAIHALRQVRVTHTYAETHRHVPRMKAEKCGGYANTGLHALLNRGKHVCVCVVCVCVVCALL